MVRMSAEERRESVVRAAMSEFAHGGYHGTSTEAIARRVGVSQPYLFRLFPNKQAIFLADRTGGSAGASTCLLCSAAYGHDQVMRSYKNEFVSAWLSCSAYAQGPRAFSLHL